MRKSLWGGIGVAAVLILACGTAGATEFMLGGSPAHVMGYIDQGAAYGVGGDHYDTKKGFQSAIFSTLLEGDYAPTPELKLFASGKFTADWAYPILSGDSEWKEKKFSDSRDELYLDTGWRKMLHEAHVTWGTGNFNVRVGKQIVSWGETDGLRLMDQINPLEQRRGLADVEFENTIIPIWLVKTEYFFKPQSSWLQDIGLELVFNPNADFQPNRGLEVGNDKGGIWAPNIDVGMIPVAFDNTGNPLAFAPARLGSFVQRIDQPNAWDRKGMEFGARVKMVVNDKIITLNYFNGRENAPITRVSGPPVSVEPASDGVLLLHMPLEGYYPRQRIAGATFSSDFPSLKSSSLGGVAPVLRLEAFYAFGETYATNEQPLARFVEYNEIRYAVGVDWKIKIPILAPRSYFLISPQFFHRKILGYPSDFTLVSSDSGPVDKDNYTTTLLVTTSYFHNKIVPMVFWMRDITNKADMVKTQVTYVHSDAWNFILGALLLDGTKEGKGFQPLANKDQVYGTVKYRF